MIESSAKADMNETVYEMTAESDPISNDLLHLVMFINYGVIVGVISSVGVMLNLINIAVFLKQGFKDSINIPLVGLAVADTGGLVSLIWMSLCYNPLVVDSFEQLDLIGVQHITAGWPHVCFTRITGWVTVFITFERYMCIAFPLRVKAILTPKRTLVILLGIFAVLIACVVPVYVAIHIDQVFNSKLNASIFTIVYRSNGASLENFSIYCSAFLQLTSFFFVILFTAGLVYKITAKSKWRQSTSSSVANDNITNRDRKAVRMVILISSIFIISFTPVIGYMLAMLFIHGFNVGQEFQNLFLFCGTFVFNLQAINSSSNIFVYLKMSTKFREVFMDMFSIKKTFQSFK